MHIPIVKTTIHLLRHGEVDNPQQVLYGRLPRFGLTAQGQAQAQAAAAYLRQRPLAAIYSSPMLRARQTAKPLAVAHPHLRPKHTPLLNEVRSVHQGRPLAELEAMGWRIYESVPPGYETPADLLARALRWLEGVRRDYAGREVAAVSHGDVVLTLRFWAEGITFTDHNKATTRQYPGHCSITTLTFDSENGSRPVVGYHLPY